MTALFSFIAYNYLIAEVAKTWPLEPTHRTIMEATTTIKSGKQKSIDKTSY